MKYLLKCSYCNHTYISEISEKDTFQCPKCERANGFTDIIKTINADEEKTFYQKSDEELIQEKKEERAENLKKLYGDDLQFLGNDSKKDMAAPQSRFSLKSLDSYVSIKTIAALGIAVVLFFLAFFTVNNYMDSMDRENMYASAYKHEEKLENVLTDAWYAVYNVSTGKAPLKYAKPYFISDITLNGLIDQVSEQLGEGGKLEGATLAYLDVTDITAPPKRTDKYFNVKVTVAYNFPAGTNTEKLFYVNLRLWPTKDGWQILYNEDITAFFTLTPAQTK